MDSTYAGVPVSIGQPVRARESAYAPKLEKSETWAARALCAETDPDAFFPEQGGSTRPAKKVCRKCPVRTACLEDALAQMDMYGVRGGLSVKERLKLIKDRESVPAGEAA